MVEEFGSRNAEVGSRNLEVGMRKWEKQRSEDRFLGALYHD
ncbi:hypothetical protein D1AOALGA4SA_2705 [Olavius algarvensis Delta 1 endosymbiont]|nr:hypothetical protein D1AOALGA4SA_2705 [Olavius algarvensis Delta 1 endosymbiont]